MRHYSYVVLDIAFFLFHTAWVIFNLSGWIWEKTRRLHLAVLLLTWFSWLGLGLFYGVGYCPCTDWHWQVKERLGETELPYSYIKYYLDRLTGLDWKPHVVDHAVVAMSLAALGLSIGLNRRDRRRMREHRSME